MADKPKSRAFALAERQERPDGAEKRSRQQLVELLNEDLSREYQAVIAYVGAAVTKSVILALVTLATALLFVPLQLDHPFWMLFFLVGIIYERRHTRMIDAYGGLAKVVPLFATVLTIVTLSSISSPRL